MQRFPDFIQQSDFIRTFAVNAIQSNVGMPEDLLYKSITFRRELLLHSSSEIHRKQNQLNLNREQTRGL